MNDSNIEHHEIIPRPPKVSTTDYIIVFVIMVAVVLLLLPSLPF
jgi:hypothetical protein